MFRYKLDIEYNGSSYYGWQKQSTLPTIQESLEKAIFNVVHEEVNVIGSGRTDTGVHAIAQVAHFDSSKDLSSYKMQHAINYHLHKEDIAVYNVQNMGEISPNNPNYNFHARFSCIERSYIYKITNRPYPLKLEKNLSWWISRPLDINSMKETSKYLIGTHDFSTFQAAGCQANSPVKTLNNIAITANSATNSNIEIYISAKSFLYHQVRNIVGSLVQVGIKKWTAEKFKENFRACDRKKGGPTAPACGLYFLNAKYLPLK